MDNNLEPDFLKMALDEAGVLVFVKDKDFKIVYANRAFLGLYPPEKRDNIIGTTTFEEFPPEEIEGFIKEDRRALEGETTEIIEEVTNYKGVTKSYLTRKIGFVSKEGAPLMLGICSDVTQLKSQEEKLVEANSHLEKFTTMAAYDLRSPLNTILSYMDLIKLDKETTLSDTANKNLADMYKSTVLMMGQISTLVDLFKNKKGFSEVTDLNQVIAQVKYNLSTEIESNNVKILASDIPKLNIQADLTRQLFQNLIENSIRYKSEKSPLIMIKFIEEVDEYVFEIEDNGIGIKIKNDPFVEAKDNSSSNIDGLGLVLCKKIVASFGGKIWIDHSFEDGCKICFSYPKNVHIEHKETVYLDVV